MCPAHVVCCPFSSPNTFKCRLTSIPNSSRTTYECSRTEIAAGCLDFYPLLSTHCYSAGSVRCLKLHVAPCSIEFIHENKPVRKTFSASTRVQSMRHVTERSHRECCITFAFWALRPFCSEPPLALCCLGWEEQHWDPSPWLGEAVNRFPSVLGKDWVCADS